MICVCIQYKKHIQKIESESSLSTTSSSSSIGTGNENDEAVLLRDWDFERFFPANGAGNKTPAAGSSNPNNNADHKLDDFNKLKLENRVKSEIFANNVKANHSFLNNLRASNNNNNSSSNSSTPDKGHKRQDSDSKLSMNFVRGFRRENSDIFLMSKRHSAVLGERPTAAASQAQPQRASAIFQRNKSKGEPILTDFVSTRDQLLDSPKKTLQQQLQQQQLLQQQQQAQQTVGIATPTSGRAFDFLRPRREKTESVIQVRNTATRQLLLENIFSQQVNTFTTHIQTQN